MPVECEQEVLQVSILMFPHRPVSKRTLYRLAVQIIKTIISFILMLNDLNIISECVAFRSKKVPRGCKRITSEKHEHTSQ